MAGLSSFSKVDVSKLDLDEVDEATSAMQGVLEGGELPEHMDMEQMMAGMGAMGGMGGGGMPALEGRDWDEYRVTSLEDADVGKIFDCTGGKGLITKKLLEAGERNDFDNPADGWEVAVAFTGRLLPEGTVFDARHGVQPLVMTVGSGSIPDFVERALKTMKRGESSRFHFKPEAAFGLEGSSEFNVPPNTSVEYDILLLDLREVIHLCGGDLRKKIIEKAPPGPGSWELPEALAEVTCEWKGELIEPRQIFQHQAQFRYSRDDKALLPFWQHVSMKRGEKAEYIVAPNLAYGDGGNSELGIPPNEKIRVTVHMIDWLNIEDVSPNHDGSALRVLLSKGDGWQKPLKMYECKVDFEVRVHDGSHSGSREGDANAPTVASGEGVVVTLGSDQIEHEMAAASEAAGCGQWGVGAALDLLLPRMQKGEHAELRCSSAFIGGPHERVDVRVKLLDWTRVEEVPGTDGQVVRKVLREAMDQYERPSDDALCTIKYTVRMRGDNTSGMEGLDADLAGEVVQTSGDEPSSFTQGDESILPCIDAAVREMKRGERALICATSAWAYGAPGGGGMPRNMSASQSASSGVVVELELTDFKKAKDVWEMSAAERAASQLRKKQQGNAAFARRQYEKAIRLYEASNTRAPTEEDLETQVGARGGTGVTGADASGGGSGADASEADDLPAVDREAVKQIRLACFLNMAACHLKLEQPSKVISCCTSALDLAPNHAKALYRRGQAYLVLADFEAAKVDLMAAVRADPTSKEPRQGLEDLKAAQARAKQAEKTAFGGMFK